MTKVYMAVTPDKYELPVHLTNSAKQMADWLGVSTNAVFVSISNGLSGKSNGYKIIKVKY